MREYKDDEILLLTEKIKLTKEVKSLLRQAKRGYATQGRKVSMAKIVCNLIIKEYGKY